MCHLREFQGALALIKIVVLVLCLRHWGRHGSLKTHKGWFAISFLLPVSPWFSKNPKPKWTKTPWLIRTSSWRHITHNPVTRWKREALTCTKTRNIPSNFFSSGTCARHRSSFHYPRSPLPTLRGFFFTRFLWKSSTSWNAFSLPRGMPPLSTQGLCEAAMTVLSSRNIFDVGK